MTIRSENVFGKSAQFATLLACLSLIAAEAHAMSRYTATSLTCDTIQTTIKSGGSAFLSWRAAGSNLPRYGIFIANRRMCHPDQGTQRTYVPASDTDACLVKKCVSLDLGK